MPTTRPLGTSTAAILTLLLAGAPARAAELDFLEQSLELPGAPAALVPADLDGDGLRDLAVVVVYTDWDQIGIEERTEMDQVEGLVEVLTIVPVLLDRRDAPLPAAMAVLATRRLNLDLGFHPWCQGPDGRFTRAPGPPLRSELTIDLDDIELRRRSLFAGDFDGDGRADFLQLGRPKRIGVHRGRAGCAYPERPDAVIELRDRIRDLALVEVQDLDGDGRADLAVTHPQTVDERGVTPPVRLDLYLSGRNRPGERSGGTAAGASR